MKAFKLNRRKIEREKSVEATNELISIAKNPRYASFRILFENRGFYSSQMKQEETKYCDKCNLLRSLPKNKKKIYFFLVLPSTESFDHISNGNGIGISNGMKNA